MRPHHEAIFKGSDAVSCTGISPQWSLDTGGGGEGVKSNAEDLDG